MCPRIKMLLLPRPPKDTGCFCFFFLVLFCLSENTEIFQVNSSKKYCFAKLLPVIMLKLNIFKHISTAFVSQHFSIFGFWRVFGEYEGKFFGQVTATWVNAAVGFLSQLGFQFRCGASKTCRTSVTKEALPVTTEKRQWVLHLPLSLIIWEKKIPSVTALCWLIVGEAKKCSCASLSRKGCRIHGIQSNQHFA